MTCLKSDFSKSFLVFSFGLLLILAFPSILKAQKFPEGYIEQFSDPCTISGFFNSFVTNRPGEYIPDKDKFLQILPCLGDSCNLNFTSKCVLDSMILGEYIIEFEIKPETLNDKNAYITFLSPIKSINSFNALLFSHDSVAFYIMEKGALKKLDIKNWTGLKEGWNKIRIQRDILTRNTTIILNNLQSTKLIFNDRRLVMGFVSFSPGNSKVSIRNIKIWAPTSIKDKSFNW
jgi:hypothetical protein